MPDIIETLQNTTRLVKIWGASQLPDGRTLSQALTLDGIPFWEVFAVDLARIYVPAALHANSTSSKIVKMIWPRLFYAKYGLRDYIYNRRNTSGCSLWPTNQTILCLDFSEHISRDVLQPIAIRLAENKGIKVVSLRDKLWETTNECSHQNGLYQTVCDHWSQQVCNQTSAMKQEVSKIYRDFLTSNILPGIIRDDKIPMWDKLENVFNSFFRAYLPLFVSHAVVARHILENHRPALVICGRC